jgi:hypothetical protein
MRTALRMLERIVPIEVQESNGRFIIDYRARPTSPERNGTRDTSIWSRTPPRPDCDVDPHPPPERDDLHWLRQLPNRCHCSQRPGQYRSHWYRCRRDVLVDRAEIRARRERETQDNET